MFLSLGVITFHHPLTGFRSNTIAVYTVTRGVLKTPINMLTLNEIDSRMIGPDTRICLVYHISVFLHFLCRSFFPL